MACGVHGTYARLVAVLSKRGTLPIAEDCRPGICLPNRYRHWLLHTRFPEKFRRFLWRRGIDVETRSPFESRRLCQLRHEFDVPVVMIVRRILHGGRVDNKVIWRVI